MVRVKFLQITGLVCFMSLMAACASTSPHGSHKQANKQAPKVIAKNRSGIVIRIQPSNSSWEAFEVASRYCRGLGSRAVARKNWAKKYKSPKNLGYVCKNKRGTASVSKK